MSITPHTDAVHSGLDDALSPVPPNEMIILYHNWRLETLDQQNVNPKNFKGVKYTGVLSGVPYHPKPEQEPLLHLHQALFVRLVLSPHPFGMDSGKLEYHIKW